MSSFFETGPMPTPNCEIQPLWVQGIQIVPNCHTLAGFAIGALRLATMAIGPVSKKLAAKTALSEMI